MDNEANYTYWRRSKTKLPPKTFVYEARLNHTCNLTTGFN